MQSAKQVAKAVIEQLPEQASWDEIMYELQGRAAWQWRLNGLDAPGSTSSI